MEPNESEAFDGLVQSVRNYRSAVKEKPGDPGLESEKRDDVVSAAVVLAVMMVVKPVAKDWPKQGWPEHETQERHNLPDDFPNDMTWTKGLNILKAAVEVAHNLSGDLLKWAMDDKRPDMEEWLTRVRTRMSWGLENITDALAENAKRKGKDS